MKARILSILLSYPKLRSFIRTAYRFTSSLLSFFSSQQLPFGAAIICDHKLSETYFGYYNNSPENNGRVIFIGKDYPDDEWKLYLRDAAGNLHSLIGGLAVSTQQGCRAMWLDEVNVIFNKSTSGLPSAYIFDTLNLSARKVSELITLEARNGVVVFGNCQGYNQNAPEYDYGFVNLAPEVEIRRWPDMTVLFKITETDKLDLCLPDNGCFIHPVLSPDATKCLIIYRFKENGVRTDKLLLIDLSNSTIVQLFDNGTFSHFCWVSEAECLGYFEYDNEIGYWTFDLRSFLPKPFMRKVLQNLGDGHPTFVDGILALDTYPNIFRIQSVFVIDFAHREIKKKIDFFSPSKFSDVDRCDLHPRLASNDCLYVDCVYQGKRQLAKIRL